MILGIGTDLASIVFFEECLADNKTNVISQTFTTQEIATATSGSVPAAERLAARFAAKEAFYKALSQVTLHQDYQALPSCPKEIEVCNDSVGRPFFSIHGYMQTKLHAYGIKKCHLSISHEKDYAIAFVILES